jgi:hypothetical protein
MLFRCFEPGGLARAKWCPHRESWNPFVFIGVPNVLTAMTFLAAWIQHVRANRVDWLQALGYE